MNHGNIIDANLILISKILLGEAYKLNPYIEPIIKLVRNYDLK